jgi:hypothetical protein
MSFKDPDEHMLLVYMNIRKYNHPKARVYAEYYEQNGHFPEGIWEDVQLLHMHFQNALLLGNNPEDVDF